jgi:hypothetical protein
MLQLLGQLAFAVPTTTDEAKGLRNGLWFIPQLNYKTVLRLQFPIDEGEEKTLEDIFSSVISGFSIANAFVVAKKEVTWLSNATDIVTCNVGSVAVHADLDIGSDFSFSATIEIDDGLIMLQLTLVKAGDLHSFLAWLGNGPMKDVLPGVFTFADYVTQTPQSLGFPVPDVSFRRVTFRFVDVPQQGGSPPQLSLQSFSLNLQLTWQFKDGGELIYFLVTYTYTRAQNASIGQESTLAADLWVAPPIDPTDPDLAFLPDWEVYDFMPPLGISLGDFLKWPACIDLSGVAVFDVCPNVLPSTLTAARFFIDSDTVSFSGSLHARLPPPGSPVPMIQLDEVDVFVAYRLHPTPDQSSIEASLAISVLIQPPPNTKWATDYGPAEIVGEIDYDSSTWTLSASVQNLWGAYLFQFFDDDLASAAASVLGDIEIVDFEVLYQYSSSQPTDLTVSATLMLDILQLSLQYTNQGSGNWSFNADASLDTNKDLSTTVGGILVSITGVDSVDDLDLPAFLTDVEIELKTADDHAGVYLLPSKDGTCVLLTIYLVLDDFVVQYVNFEYAKSSSNAGISKTVLLASIASMDPGRLPNVPLVGTVPQPFDELLFMWVAPGSSSTSDGLTLAEVTLLNEAIAQITTLTGVTSLRPVLWKSVKKDTAHTDVVIAKDKHLMLILKDLKGVPTIALDYRFGATDTPPSSRSARASKQLALVGDDPPVGNPDASGKVDYQMTAGPLSIRNFGIKFSESTVAFQIDASITIGPVTADLYAFQIGLDFGSAGGGWSLHNLPTPSVSLEGLQISYINAPVDLKGLIMHIQAANEDLYEGSLTVAYAPWLFEAAGCYGEVTVTDPNSGQPDTFKTFFVFAMLQGPLLTFEFAEVSGITAGFGYNSDVRLPVATEVPTFPLIQGGSTVVSPGMDPQQAQSSLVGSPWFGYKDGARWIAVGLTASAFSMLDVTAVVVLETEPSLKLGIYAIATLDVPKSDPYPFARAQLAMAATMDIAAGVLKIDGQLTPASYILNPMCHLTGGFALYSWAASDNNPDDAALRGDWVFTLGGYHRAFKAPSQFPTPPRLGIAWDMDIVSLRGEAYFACTPDVCMGGGRWGVSLSVGVLEAWYEFWADFLVTLKPFYFIANGGVDVGVSFTLDLWLITIHISVEIGATIYVEGPPIHGTVHVDFWVFGFDIDFGDWSTNGAPALSLDDLVKLACQQKTDSSTFASAASIFSSRIEEADDEDEGEDGQLVDDPPPVIHVLVPEDGLIPDGGTTSTPSAGTLWYVRAAPFSFRISCKVPIQSADIVTPLEEGGTSTDTVKGTGVSIGARPMCVEGLTLTSTLTVTIQPIEAQSKRRRRLYLDENQDTTPLWNRNATITKSLPNALWGDCEFSLRFFSLLFFACLSCLICRVGKLTIAVSRRSER